MAGYGNVDLQPSGWFPQQARPPQTAAVPLHRFARGDIGEGAVGVPERSGYDKLQIITDRPTNRRSRLLGIEIPIADHCCAFERITWFLGGDDDGARSGVAAIQRALWSFQYLDLLKARSEEHTSELQSLMRISYAVFCLKQKKK